jgi:cytochrome c peroxidase
MFKFKYLIFLFLGITLVMACKQDDDQPMDDLIEIDETPYELLYGALPEPNIPADNKLTKQGVELGRMLFYEPMLSKDGSQTCTTCHRQPDGFSDSLQFSLGVEGLPGKRHAMPVFNMAWHTNEFFWDGRAHLLRDQAILPIQDPLEMNETLENVVAKLSETKLYQDQFIRAFGEGPITSEKMSLALEQFMNSIVSSDSKYDKYLAGEVELTESEARGLALFEAEYNPFFPDVSGADCKHCHGGINFKNDQYMNNGLDTDANQIDIGREIVTNDPADRAKFKVPSLRNIAVTGPYMHDGRFTTLEEVIDHYNEGIQESATADPTVLNTKDTGLLLTDQDKIDLINYLKTLTDDAYLNNEAYKSPF